jgi:hypothetical protein
MEDLVIETLAESGFEAKLDITSVTSTDATIRNIRLNRDGKEVLRASELRAKYVWPDIRDGVLERLEFEELTLQLTLGEDWKPSDAWLVKLLDDAQNTDGAKNAPARFPKNGVQVTDGTLALNSPLGEATLYIDATVPAADQFDAEITLAPSALSYGGFRAEGAGFATLNRNGPTFTVEGQTQTAVLSNADIQIEDATLRLKGTANLDERTYHGEIGINGDNIASTLFAADAVDLTWVGDISRNTALTAKGQWNLTTKAARTPRAARADELADTLSLATALRVVPVTEHYAPTLVKTVRDFLVGSDLAGTGHLTYGPSGFTITTETPVSVTTPRNRLTLSPRAETPLYIFDRAEQKITVGLDAGFTRPTSLKLTNIQLEASSPNGIKLDGISRFSTGLSTTENWRVTSVNQRPVRLGPIRAELNYRGAESPRRLAINTNLSFDGGLPGGYVEDLALRGRLDVALHENRQVIDFTPNPNARVTFARMETPTAWIIEDAEFSLPTTRSLFVKRPDVGLLNARLGQAEFTFTQPATQTSSAQRLELQAEALSLEGSIFGAGRQNWDAIFTNATYQSETLPAAGTKAAAASAHLTAKITPDVPVELTLDSPNISAQTPLVNITNMTIDLTGTPLVYEVAHRDGSIKLIGTEFAETARAAGLVKFPADGVVNFADGRFTGQTNLRIAKANDAKVIVDYAYENGVGEAAVLIPSINFTNNGLQPQSLFPSLRGKIASVEGEAQARLKIGFADGALTHSSGVVDVLDMNLGTAPGPIESLNTSVTFSSLLPMETDGPQTLTMRRFNPGLELEDGTVTYRLLPTGVGVDFAEWPIGNGALSLDPFTWLYAAEENRVTMRVKDVSLGDFLKNIGDSKIEATGTVIGTFPIIIRGVEVLVDGGRLSVPEGGVLRVDPGPSVPIYSQDEAIAVLREKRASEYANLARDALREFRYRELSAAIDGPLDGELEIGLNFDGANDRVLNAQPFRFDISVAGELFNIARSFNSNAQVKSEILRQNGALPQGILVDGETIP